MIRQPHNSPVSMRDYVLMEDYFCAWTQKGVRWRIVIPRGFVYDGASVPRLAWSAVGMHPDGLLRAAALVHDWLYVHRGNLPLNSWQRLDGEIWREAGTRWTRRQADLLFYDLLRKSGVPLHQCEIAYTAVRLGGGIAWRT